MHIHSWDMYSLFVSLVVQWPILLLWDGAFTWSLNLGMNWYSRYRYYITCSAKVSRKYGITGLELGLLYQASKLTLRCSSGVIVSVLECKAQRTGQLHSVRDNTYDTNWELGRVWASPYVDDVNGSVSVDHVRPFLRMREIIWCIFCHGQLNDEDKAKARERDRRQDLRGHTLRHFCILCLLFLVFF